MWSIVITWILVCFLGVAFFCGCSTVEWLVEDWVQEQIESVEQDKAIQEEVTPDEALFKALNWAYGGFKGGNAIVVPGAAITALQVHKNGLSYNWQSGGCELLGASNATDASQTIACLFCKVDGSWRGGKFDWISTSRLTRDFKNIETNYHGWKPADLKNATEFAFVIVSKDGKKRTNISTFQPQK